MGTQDRGVVFPAQEVSLELATNEKLAYETALDVGFANVFTHSVWWKPIATPPTCYIMEFVQSAGTANRIVWFYVNEDFRVYLYDSAGANFKQYGWGTGLISTNAWNLTTITWNGTDLLSYNNGAAAGAPTKTIDDAGTMTATNRFVRLGGGNAGNYMSGDYHSAGIWNSVLSLNEHIALYNSGSGSTVDWANNSGNYVSSSNLQHWWRCGFDAADIGKDYGAGTSIDVMVDNDNITADDIVADYPGI
jgi:hypothetical protein